MRARSSAAWWLLVLAVGCFGSPPGVDDGGTATDDTDTATATDATGTVGETGDPCAACAADDECVEGRCVPPGCGDGSVGDGEECDLGTDNAQTGSCKLDCTLQFCGDGQVGPVETCDDANDVAGDGCDQCVLETCGDGERNPGEVCDDGNAEDGDGCNANCRPSGEVVWEHFHNGATNAADRANDIALLDDRVVVVGAVVDVGVNPERWIRILDTDGGFVFTSATPKDEDRAAEMYGVDCGLACIAVGTQLVGAMNIGFVALQRIGADGTDDDAVLLDNLAALGRQGFGISLAPLGADIVGFAQVAVGVQDNGFVEHVDETLSSESYTDLLTGQGFAVLRRIARAPNRTFTVGWRLAVDMGSTEAFVFALGGAGVENMATIDGSLHTLALSVAPDPGDASVVVVGTTHDAMSTGSAVLRRYGANLGLVWNRDTSFGGVLARLDDVEIAANGDIVAVGAVQSKGATPPDLLVVRLEPDGTERWRRTFEDPGHDVAHGVALDGATGAIFIAGRRSLHGTEDAFIARLTP